MKDKLLMTVVKRSNTAYLKELSGCLNYVFGCALEKVIFSSLFGDRYKDYSEFIDPNILEIVNQIKSLTEYQRLFLMGVFNYLSYYNENKKYNVTYFTINNVNHKSNKHKDYLFLLFNYNQLLDSTKCFLISKIEDEDLDLLKNILNKLAKVVFCNDKSFLGENINKLKGKIDIDEVLLISNDSVTNISKEDFTNNYFRSMGIELDQSETILPIIECFENSLVGFNLKLFK